MDAIVWRQVESDDVPAWAALYAAAEAVDRTGEHYSESDLREELSDPEAGPDNRLAGWDGARMVAYAGVRARSADGDHLRIDVEGVVDPADRGRGLGTRLVEWVRDRAERLHAEAAPLVEARVGVDVLLDNAGAVELFEEQGFTAVNWSALMRIGLDGRAIPAPTWPEGVSVHRYGEDWSGRVFSAHNVAFADHFGFVEWTAQRWHQWVDGSRNFRPGQSWVLVDDADPAFVIGYILTNEYDAYEEATGRKEAYVGHIAVRREHRGRGLASNLLRHALREYQQAGFAESALGVDTNNPTGAFGLYERAGYEVERRIATYRLVLDPHRAAAGSA